MQIADHRNANPAPDEARAEVMANLGFGVDFTDNMVSVQWNKDRGWHDARLIPYGPLSLDPAASVLHYAQEIFEGLKAYRHLDGSIWAFRPEANAERFARSAARLALPQMPVEDFIETIKALVAADSAWVPDQEETSLYLRPFMIATEAFLGVRPATQVQYLCIASPVGAYFSSGVKPVAIWLSDNYTRAAIGGTGSAKCGGNYAASLAAQTEAAQHGCAQVVFLDAQERTWVEELGGMNLFFVHANGEIVTPELTGTILEGVTRSSIIELAEQELGMKVIQRKVSIDEWRDGVASGEITEVFACGTAAVITPVGQLVWDGGSVGSIEAPVGEVTAKLRKTLIDLQYGRVKDTRGWMERLA